MNTIPMMNANADAWYSLDTFDRDEARIEGWSRVSDMYDAAQLRAAADELAAMALELGDDDRATHYRAAAWACESMIKG